MNGSEEPGFDPVHVGGMILLTVLGITVLFRDLWTLLVYQGSLWVRVVSAGFLIFLLALIAAAFRFKSFTRG